MNYRRSLGLILATGLLLGTSSAFALTDGDKEAVRALANDAAQDFDRGQFAAARDKFQRAYAIAKVPRLALRAAQANVKLGQWVAAYELLRQAIALERNDLWLGKTQEQAQADALRELNALQSRLPKLTIQVQGANTPDVMVTIDEVAVPAALIGIERYVDPGTRHITGKWGEQKSEQSVTLAEGERKQVVIKFVTPASGSASTLATNEPKSPGEPAISKARASSSPAGDSSSASSKGKPRTQRTVGWVGIGIGAAGVAIGTLAGLVVASKYGDLSKACPDHQCSTNDQGKVTDYRHWRTISTVGFIVGGVGTAAGVTLLLTSPKQENQPYVAMWMGTASLGLKGAF